MDGNFVTLWDANIYKILVGKPQGKISRV